MSSTLIDEPVSVRRAPQGPAARRPAPARPWRVWRRLTAADWVFVALLAFGAAVIVYETRGFSFYYDEWDFVVDRQGMSPAVLLRPHGPHLSLVPVLVFKGLLAVFGGRSYLPFRLLAAFDMVIVALAVGIGCRRRWGPWCGLAPVAVLVCLGPGAATTLWPFQDGYAIAVAAGIAALLELDARRPGADCRACLWLALSLASASQGIGFVAGAAVMVALGDHRIRRAWVALAPAGGYGAWYVAYGHQASETHLSLWPTVPGYVDRSLAATADGTIGLAQAAGHLSVLRWVFMLGTLAAVVALVFAILRGRRPPVLVAGIAVTLLVVWSAAALSNTLEVRPPNAPRYLWSNLAILSLGLCTVLPRPRLRGRTRPIACLVLLAVCAFDLPAYAAQRVQELNGDRAEQADLGALELARAIVPRDYSPAAVSGLLGDIHSAASFYRAADAYDLKVDTPAEIARQPRSRRDEADAVLRGTEVRVAPLAEDGAADCRGAGDGDRTLTVAPGTELTLSGPIVLAARRFGPDYGRVAAAAAGHAVAVRFGRDTDPTRSWQVRARGRGRVCG
jgi:hypothetical protein